MAIKDLRVLILCFKGQDLHLHTLHAIWGIWEDYHRRWADELLSEILPRFHSTLRSVRNVQSLSPLFCCLTCEPVLCIPHLIIPRTAVCEVWNCRSVDALPQLWYFNLRRTGCITWLGLKIWKLLSFWILQFPLQCWD